MRVQRQTTWFYLSCHQVGPRGFVLGAVGSCADVPECVNVNVVVYNVYAGPASLRMYSSGANFLTRLRLHNT